MQIITEDGSRPVLRAAEEWSTPWDVRDYGNLLNQVAMPAFPSHPISAFPEVAHFLIHFLSAASWHPNSWSSTQTDMAKAKGDWGSYTEAKQMLMPFPDWWPKDLRVRKAISHSLQNSALFLNLRPSLVLCSYVIASIVGLLFSWVCIFPTKTHNSIPVPLYGSILAGHLVCMNQVTQFIAHTADPPQTPSHSHTKQPFARLQLLQRHETSVQAAPGSHGPHRSPRRGWPATCPFLK